MEDRSFPTRNSMALDNALGLLKKKKQNKTRDRDGKGSPEDSCAGLALLVKEVEPNYSLVSHNRVWKSPCDSPGESRERPSQGPTKHHRHPDKGLSKNTRAAQERHLLYELPATALLPWGIHSQQSETTGLQVQRSEAI